MALPLLLTSKYKLYAQHHERLLTRPDPAMARQTFERRVRLATGLGQLRFAMYVGLYFAAFATGVTLLTDFVGLGALGDALRPVTAAASTLTASFIVGIFLCTRYLSLLEVDLAFFSQESRLHDHQPRLT